MLSEKKQNYAYLEQARGGAGGIAIDHEKFFQGAYNFVSHACLYNSSPCLEQSSSLDINSRVLQQLQLGRQEPDISVKVQQLFE